METPLIRRTVAAFAENHHALNTLRPEVPLDETLEIRKSFLRTCYGVEEYID